MRSGTENGVGSGVSRSRAGRAAASDHRWAIVLAGGEGSRLSGLTRDLHGVPVPKQFCSLNGASTLLHDALARASAVAPIERTVVIVAANQARHWQSQLAALPAANIVIQPRNRGTAIGILLPTLHILARDPQAQIMCLPSDHFVADEPVLARAIDAALADLEHTPDEITFLGIEPDEADPGLGYIAPVEPAARGSQRIARFIEKPDAALAGRLIESGALWNSFIFAGRGAEIVRMIRDRFPAVVDDIAFAMGLPGDALARGYETLPPIDFSKHVVEGSEHRLRVRAVPACGWSDLGTPQRLGECIDRFRLDSPALRRTFRHEVINLAEAYRCFASAPALGSVA